MDNNSDFIAAVKEGDVAKVTKLFKKKYIKEISDGGQALHWAVIHNNSAMVEYLLSEEYDIEAETTMDLVEKIVVGKLRAIHIAAFYGDPNTLKKLLEGRCNLFCETKDGETPLDIAIRLDKKECAEILRNNMALQRKDFCNNSYLIYLLKSNRLSKVMDAETRETMLDKLMANNGMGIMDSITYLKVTEEEIGDWKAETREAMKEESYKLLDECLLYRCICQEYHRGFMILCTPDMVNRNLLFRELTVLEYTVKSRITTWVEHVLRRSFDVNESWSRAVTIAEERNLIEIVKLLRSRIAYLIRRKARGFSRLHIAVFDNAPDMIDYLLANELVDPDEGDGAVGTALSLAYELDYPDCIDMLHKHNVNTITVDWLNRGPLSKAVSNRNETSCDVLIEKIDGNIETKDYAQLTVVHRAILNDCESICNRLLEKDLDCTKCVNMNSQQLANDLDMKLLPENSRIKLTHQETLYSLCLKANGRLYPNLLVKIDKCSGELKDGDGNTLLHLCSTSLLHSTCSDLLSINVDCNLLNRNQNSPLSELLLRNYDPDNVDVKDDMIKTVQVLVKGGASLNIKSGDGTSVFQAATKYGNEGLLLALVCDSRKQESIEKTDFEIWLQKRFFDFIKVIIPLIDDSKLSSWITIDLIESTLDLTNLSLLKEMFDKADPSVKSVVVESLLNKAATNNDELLFIEFIKTKISQDSALHDGQSLLSDLFRQQKFEFIETVFSSGNAEFLVRRTERNNMTPLHVCIECQCWEFVDYFFIAKAPIDEEDSNGLTPLGLLFSMISDTEEKKTLWTLLKYAKMLIMHSADIHKINRENRTTLSYLRKNDIKQTIEEFVQNR